MTATWDHVTQFFANDTGFQFVDGPLVVMWGICGVLFYLALKKGFQPLILVPVAFGVLLANLPARALCDGGWTADGMFHPTAGIFYYLSQGIHLELLPPLLFLGIGVLTDFGPLIANPRAFLLGGAAQVGLFAAAFMAVASGFFTVGEAASVGTVGAACGPASLFVANKLAAGQVGPIAAAAYLLMGLAALIQPPIMKALTTKAERQVRMHTLRVVTRRERILFPLLTMVLGTLVVPQAASLCAMLMMGNLLRESGVLGELLTTRRSEIASAVTVLVGSGVGMTLKAETFLRPATLGIFALGFAAFALSTASGVMMAKVMNKFSPDDPVNPLIGSAGVAAMPMSAKISQEVGAGYDAHNVLLPHALGASGAGVLATVLAAGYLLGRLLN